MLVFTDLIDDVLLHIFSFLDPADLYTLSSFNVERFNSLVKWTMQGRVDSLLITGSSCFPGTNPITNDKERLRVHANWIYGNFQSSAITVDNRAKNGIGRLRVNADNIYMSNEGQIVQCARFKGGSASTDDQIKFGAMCDPMVSQMVLSGPHLFTGTQNGTCSYIRDGKRILDNHKIHYNNRDVLAMDYCPVKQILATSNQREICLFTVSDRSVDLTGLTDWKAGCLTMNPSNNDLLVGNVSSDYETIDGDVTTLNALCVYDMQTLKKKDLRCNSSGILDMVWHSSPNVILTGHWTGDLRMMDLRTETDEVTIEKEGKEDLNTSLQYDGRYGVVCGYRTSAEVCLYDLRKPTGHVRSFGMFKQPRKSAYLVEVLADSRNLYVVTYDGVTVCDFTG